MFVYFYGTGYTCMGLFVVFSVQYNYTHIAVWCEFWLGRVVVVVVVSVERSSSSIRRSSSSIRSSSIRSSSSTIRSSSSSGSSGSSSGSIRSSILVV
jgi:hypothetical protein